MSTNKVKQKGFVDKNGECIAEIVALAENGQLRIYVAWENESAAENSFFKFFKSEKLYKEISEEAIKETMKRGFNISRSPEGRKIFKALF